ncbi:Bug family tripartite tricarboxylate transporter substrate binding protein [Variovorax sp. ZT4R33]|uniref:Bug family tripartite tricarboxylate transporter substrate binding protein n=1 Tax=Variovorax sp. ZT4R33 TaxID=3443743 RepID=UPI003F470122
MLSTRRTARYWTALAIAGSLGFFSISSTSAQDKYPSKPIRWIVGFPAGGGTDFLARTIANAMSEQMGQPIVIDNRPGASAMIGAELAARAPADGYTVWSGDQATLIFNPMFYKKVAYKLGDFQPVGLMGKFNFVVCTGATSGIESLSSAVDAVKKRNAMFSYGSSGAGTPQHLVMEMFKKSAGIDLTHVPYRGLPPVVQDLIGNQIQFGTIDVASAEAQTKAGKLKPLAVTAPVRLPSFPEVPTMKELGYKDVEMYAWQGMLVPVATPRPIVEQLAANLQKALQRPDVRNALMESGLEVMPSSAQEFGSYIEQQSKSWGEVIRASGIKLEMN